MISHELEMMMDWLNGKRILSDIIREKKKKKNKINTHKNWQRPHSNAQRVWVTTLNWRWTFTVGILFAIHFNLFKIYTKNQASPGKSIRWVRSNDFFFRSFAWIIKTTNIDQNGWHNETFYNKFDAYLNDV